MKQTILFPLAMISGFSLLSFSVITTTELKHEKKKLHQRLSLLTQPSKALQAANHPALGRA